MSGTELIAAERERQISQEGWTPEHDDSHKGGCLARAACAYAMPTGVAVTFRGGSDADIDFGLMVWPRHFWPWANDEFKRSMVGPITQACRIVELTKAGALIAAEIDRLLRTNPVAPDAGCGATESEPKLP